MKHRLIEVGAMLSEMSAHRAGKGLKSANTLRKGLANTSKAFIKLFTGEILSNRPVNVARNPDRSHSVEYSAIADKLSKRSRIFPKEFRKVS